MTILELMAHQENLAVKRHWAMPYGESNPEEERRIAAHIPENWYGPEKKPSPLLGRNGAIRCEATNKAMRNCRCAVCGPYVQHWK
jgi:hypothetical protein